MTFRDQMRKGSTEILVLSLLVEGPMYGYEISQQLEQRSGGYFEMKEGLLYPALHRMQQKGWLSSEWQTVDGRHANTIHLTSIRSAKSCANRRRMDQLHRRNPCHVEEPSHMDEISIDQALAQISQRLHLSKEAEPNCWQKSVLILKMRSNSSRNRAKMNRLRCARPLRTLALKRLGKNCKRA
jgi:PadR family transcriptional regulator, regulatory protein PadR